MKKALSGLFFLAMLMLGLIALAEEAPNISVQAVFKGSSKAWKLKNLNDGLFNTTWQGDRGEGSLEIFSPSPCYGLYISWTQNPQSFTIQTKLGAEWVTYQRCDATAIVHQYYPLNGLTSLRLVPDRDDGKSFGISEVSLLGDGEVPAWVQRWEPTVKDADLMLLFAHPDDEVLYFGGLLPYYGAQRQLKVLPVSLSYATPLRRSELLNCLWSLGVKNYPVLGPFEDRYSFNLDKAYALAGRRKVSDFITGLYRRYKPEVVVTHDINGEYGHGMHRLCADAAEKAIAFANDPMRSPDSFKAFGAFQVQKLYLHLYNERSADVRLVMDWDVPLSAFGGKTGIELALAGYQDHHLSQHRYEQYKVEPRSSPYSCYEFGLKYSAVGPDIHKNDLTENVLP